MTTIQANLQTVMQRIDAACRQARRPPASVLLLAISKTFPTLSIQEAYFAGQRSFGENYVQEAVEKITELAGLDIDWHFTGPLQSNKTRLVASHFNWVHGIDRYKIAQRLSEARDAHLPPLNVCIQVNLSGEATKGGADRNSVSDLAHAVAMLPRLRLRGLMTIPEPTPDAALLRRRYAELRSLRDALNTDGLGLDTLSMGMSSDLELAIEEGATIVRVGSAIFGARNPANGTTG